MSHLKSKPGHDVLFSHPAISHIRSLWIKRIASQPDPIPTSQYLGLKVCVPAQAILIYQIHPCHEMYISRPSMSTLTSIKVPILASHLHSNSIALEFRLHLNLIQVKIIASQLHLGANIPPSRFWGKLITSTHTASQLHEAPYIYTSHLHPGRVSHQTKA